MLQACSLSLILFSVYMNDLLKEVEHAELVVQLSSGTYVQQERCTASTRVLSLDYPGLTTMTPCMGQLWRLCTL